MAADVAVTVIGSFWSVSLFARDDSRRGSGTAPLLGAASAPCECQATTSDLRPGHQAPSTPPGLSNSATRRNLRQLLELFASADLLLIELAGTSPEATRTRGPSRPPRRSHRSSQRIPPRERARAAASAYGPGRLLVRPACRRRFIAARERESLICWTTWPLPAGETCRIQEVDIEIHVRAPPLPLDRREIATGSRSSSWCAADHACAVVVPMEWSLPVTGRLVRRLPGHWWCRRPADVHRVSAIAEDAADTNRADHQRSDRGNRRSTKAQRRTRTMSGFEGR